MIHRILNHWISNKKFFYKLIFSYFFTAIIPVIFIGVLSYNVSISNLEKQSISNLMQAQEKYEANVVNNLAEYINLCNGIYYDQKMHDFISGKYYKVNPNYYYDQVVFKNDYLMPKVQTIFSIKPNATNLSIISYGDNPIEIIGSNYDDIIDIKDSEYSGNKTKDSQAFDYELKDLSGQNFQFYNIERVKGKQWFKQIRGNADDYKWAQITKDKQFKSISLLREIDNFDDFQDKKIGLIKLTVKLVDIFNEEKIDSNSYKGFSLFFDKSGELLSPETDKINYLNKNQDKIMSLILSPQQNKSLIVLDNVIIKRIIPNTEWIMLSIYPIEQIKIGAGKIKSITLIALMGSFILLFFITYRISSVFSKRITNITHYISAYKNENIVLDTKLIDTHNDEIGYLARSYNDMVVRINTLIKDVYKAKIDKKEYELKALQAQINPHFLYNSLSAISRLSSLGESEKVSYMVRCLTHFYRMTLNNGRNIISIEGEIEQVKAYIDIYNIRKRDFFNVYYDIEPAVLEFKTVKVILQPFVENIFEHAIYNRTRPINILLSARKGNDSIIFTIIDDGIGIRSDKQSGLLTNENTKSYGIKNVNERIQIQYGINYGVEIYSKYGIGTVVTIKIPINS